MSAFPSCPPDCPCPLACHSDPDDAYDDEPIPLKEENQPCEP